MRLSRDYNGLEMSQTHSVFWTAAADSSKNRKYLTPTSLKAGMHNIRPTKVFNLAGINQNYVSFLLFSMETPLELITNLAREYSNDIFWPAIKSELCIPALGNCYKWQIQKRVQEIGLAIPLSKRSLALKDMSKSVLVCQVYFHYQSS